MKRAGRNIHPCQRALVPHHMEGRQKVVSPRIQQGFLRQCAGSDQPHDLAFHNSLITTLFRLSRAFHLLTNGHAKAFADQGQKVPLGRVMRHPAHRDIVAIMLAAFCQGDVQCLCRGHRIVKEHLVKIAHPIEQQRIGMLCFDLQILRHHGRDRACSVAHRRPLAVPAHIISPC